MATINFLELLKNIASFVGKFVTWINLNIIHNAGVVLKYVKYVGNLIVKILLLIAGLIKWLIGFI